MMSHSLNGVDTHSSYQGLWEDGRCLADSNIIGIFIWDLP